MVERLHPVAPEFRGCPVGRPGAMTPERRAQLLLVYFTPWVLDGSMERPPHVVHAQQLQAAGDDGQRKSWQEGLNAYLKRGCLSQEICQIMQNFILVFLCGIRPPVERMKVTMGSRMLSSSRRELSSSLV